MSSWRALAVCATALLWSQPVLAQSNLPEADRDASSRTEPSSLSPEPAASESAGARAAFEEGLRLLRAERWAEAEAQFRRSVDITPRPSARYDLAFVLYRQGRAKESAAILENLLHEPDRAVDPEYRAYAGALLARLMAEPSMSASVPALTGDGPTERPLAARLSETPARTRAVTHLGSGTWFLWGTTAALAAGVVTTGLLTLSAKSALSNQLDAFPGNRDQIDQARRRGQTLTVITDALLGVTAIGGAVSLYFTLSNRRGTTVPVTVDAGLGLSGVAMRARF